MSAPVEIAIAVVERDGEFLVGKRPEGAPLADFWEFPGGKVEPCETASEAASRECREETGLDVIVGDKICTVLHKYPHGILHLHFLACQPANNEQSPNPRFHWLPLREVLELEFPAANAALFAQLRRRAATAR